MQPSLKRKKFLIAVFVLLGLCVAVHSRGLHGPFMIDDFAYTHDRQDANREEGMDSFFTSETQHYNPLNTIVNRALFKAFKEPLPLHVINLLLFYVSCLMLLIFVRQVTGNDVLAFGVSALFCVHPMNAEIIDHITLNIIIITGIFQQAALMFLVKHEENRQKGYYLLALCSFAGALLSHEMALLFPLFVFSLFYFIKKESWKNCVLRSIPFVLMSVLYFLLWLQFAGDNARFLEKVAKLNISLASYTATFLHLTGWYLRNLFIPTDIVFIKNLEPVFYHLWEWNVLFLAIAASIGMLFYKTGKSFLGFALAWFLTGFLLAIPAVFTHASMGMVIEPNWFYFASQGFFMLMAWPLGRLRKKGQGVVIALFIAIAIYWAMAAQFQHSVNRSEREYADHWLQRSPHNRQAILILGTHYITDPGYEIRPEFVPDMLWLTEFHAGYGHREAASRLLARLTDGKVPASWDNDRLIRLAAVYYKIGDLERSKGVSAYLMTQDPGPGIYLQLGAGFDRQGLTEEALQFIKENIRRDPASPEPYYLYGIILANQDRWDEAIAWLEKGQSLAPADQRFPEIIRQIKYLKGKSGTGR